MRRQLRALLPVACLVLATTLHAEEAKKAVDEPAPALRLESSVVTGNRELPKVMSIVPWKKSQPGELVGRPSSSLLNEVLAPVDREVFRRQLRYRAKLMEQARATTPEQGND